MMNTRKSVFLSMVSLVLCLSMLLGTTYAWFTDSVVSGDNIIQSGTLDIDLHWTDDLNGTWHETENVDNDPIFNYDNWEPGFTQVRYLKVINAGNLAFKYALRISPNGEVGDLAEVMDVYFVKNPAQNIDTRGDIANMLPVGTLAELIADPTDVNGVLLPAGMDEPGFYSGEMILGVVIKMQETAGNAYQDSSVGESFNVELHATQYTYEEDIFGNDYDTDAQLPGFDFPATEGDSGSADITVSGGQVAENVTVSGTTVSAQVPAGVKVTDGADKLSLSVKDMDATESNIQLKDGEALKSVNVHMDGVAADNTVPMTVTMPQAAAKGLNKGNLQLYHVENGTTVAMTQVDTLAELTAHNQFYYDPATGDVTLSLATFSEIALVANTVNAWNGDIAEAFSGGTGAMDDPYIIANADQLAYFNKLISAADAAYNTAHYRLASDLNFGGEENANNGNVWYPIGYWKQQEGKNADEEVWYDYGGAFKGIFDGAGHTVTGIYQNTWIMNGNYDHGYWDAAMGLFGYVYKGTVKNLTVDNFSSDGEFTPTGVIAAYAANNATFENIAITNCNPRVYNTGNGGIIGIAGNNSDTTEKSVTLKNITVDNSNKISALWGSWDVACGGLIGMYRGNGEIKFENCHVSAQIDVNNDVCANYQYYAYRYAGMMIGSVRENVTIGGYVYPKMDNISATGCTVHFGDWNDYYYCELVANTLASYTHDHQFSRLTQVKSISGNQITYLDNTTGTVPTSGRYNYVVVNKTNDDGSFAHATENATCFHFVNGVQHFHDKPDADNPDIYETKDIDGNGQLDDLKEDNQHIYLEFKQLFTGYGWGVTSKGIEDFKGITNIDITVGNQEESEEKFQVKDPLPAFKVGETYKVGELFTAKDGANINGEAVQVSVSAANGSKITATFTPDQNDWREGTLVFHDIAGAATVTIQDYQFCKPTSFAIKDGERIELVKFMHKFTNTGYTYRVGNRDAVTLKYLFEEGALLVDDAAVTVTATNGVYTSNNTKWEEGTLNFAGYTGPTTVTISENGVGELTLNLLVVDAVNATSATSATTNNVVLLQDAGFKSLEVSGGYTLYGNGFTLTCGSDQVAADLGYEFVKLNSGILDNVQIVCPNFDYAALYKSNLEDAGNRKETDSAGKTRYYNARSAVSVSGNSQILNSRISGARAAVNVTSGNLVIDNSRIELGAVANILIGAASEVTLRDVTLVQKPVASTVDSSKKLMGLSVLFQCDDAGNAAPITLEGTLIQNAWVDEDDKQYVPSMGESVVGEVMKKSDYLHNIDGKSSLNLGLAYIPADMDKPVLEPQNITDSRIDKASVPYDKVKVSFNVVIYNITAYVYSYKNTNGTAESFKTEATYAPNKYNDIIGVTYSDTKDGVESGKSFGTDGWTFELNVDLDKVPGYALDFSKLTMTVNGVKVTDYKVNGGAKPTSPVAVTAGGTSYTLTTTVDGKECTATFKVTGTETSKESPKLVASNYAAGLCVASSYGGTWSGAAPALEGIQIKYWSVAEKQYKTINLADYTPEKKGKLNGTNTTYTITGPNNDFTLTMTGGQVHSSNKVNAIPVCVENGGDYTLYFVAATSSGLVNTGNSARSVPVSYTFKDNNNGDVLTFSHSWSVEENKNEQYNYSDFCNGKLTKLEGSSGGGGGCVTPDTLITLADGSQKRIDQVTYEDRLLVWDFFNGKYTTAPAALIVNHGEGQNTVIKLTFENGAVVKVVNAHAFFDMDLNEMVLIKGDNVKDYIGHSFASVSGNSYKAVKLVDIEVEETYSGSYTLVSAVHYNFVTEGMFSLTNAFHGMQVGLEMGEGMKYDTAKLKSNAEKYGLYTYDDFKDYVTFGQYLAFNGAYLKLSVEKGGCTFEGILKLIEDYLH